MAILVTMGVDGDDYPAAQTAFGAAWHRLRDAIRATRNPQERFDRATETRERASKIVGEAANDRADAAAGIQDAEDLSLAELGNRISTTKQGAYRLTSKSRQKEQQ